MNKKTTTTLAAMCAVSMASFAQAQTTISQEISFTEVLSEIKTISFDPYLGDPGDLVKIEWSYDLQISGGQFELDNDGNAPTTITATLGATLNVASDTDTLDTGFDQIFTGLDITNVGTYDLGADDGDLEVGGTANFSSSPAYPDGDYAILVGDVVSISGTEELNSLFASQYFGPGTIDLDLTGSNIIETVGGTGVQGAFDPVTLDGSVTLTYTIIPEPSSALLACTGLIGLLMRRRR